MSITFSSCFYIIKSKFDPRLYVTWMNNFISIVNNFNLVIYTDEKSGKYIDTKNNPKIKIILKPMDSFYTYKYKDYWIINHNKNTLLNENTSWELNMLWSEKIWFVKETIERKYYDTEYYGWCDIGYFRNKLDNTHTKFLSNWPDNNKIAALDKGKIVYACINNDKRILNYLSKIVRNKNEHGVPKQEIPAIQSSIAGGFFILYKDKIHWWSQIYEDKLVTYFKNNYLVKDDQIILVDCILSNQESFLLFRENNRMLDNWFMFQRILLT